MNIYQDLSLSILRDLVRRIPYQVEVNEDGSLGLSFLESKFAIKNRGDYIEIFRLDETGLSDSKVKLTEFFYNRVSPLVDRDVFYIDNQVDLRNRILIRLKKEI